MDRSRPWFDRITPRERDCLEALVSGPGTLDSVADELGISKGTVEVHLHNVKLKTQLESRVAIAVAWTRLRMEEERRLQEDNEEEEQT